MWAEVKEELEVKEGDITVPVATVSALTLSETVMSFICATTHSNNIRSLCNTCKRVESEGVTKRSHTKVAEAIMSCIRTTTHSNNIQSLCNTCTCIETEGITEHLHTKVAEKVINYICITIVNWLTDKEKEVKEKEKEEKKEGNGWGVIAVERDISIVIKRRKWKRRREKGTGGEFFKRWIITIPPKSLK